MNESGDLSHYRVSDEEGNEVGEAKLVEGEGEGEGVLWWHARTTHGATKLHESLPAAVRWLMDGRRREAR